MFWKSKPVAPTAQYATQEFQRLMQMLRRWLVERAPDANDDEIFRLTVHVLAVDLHILRSARMSQSDVETFIVAMTREIGATFRLSPQDLHIALNAAQDRLERHSMHFVTSLLDEVRSMPPATRSTMGEETFQTVGSSACAALVKKLERDGFARG